LEYGGEKRGGRFEREEEGELELVKNVGEN
jgi:hypothetical protein